MKKSRKILFDEIQIELFSWACMSTMKSKNFKFFSSFEDIDTK